MNIPPADYGKFAVSLLEAEKPKRTKTPIEWQDGAAVAEIAKGCQVGQQYHADCKPGAD